MSLGTSLQGGSHSLDLGVIKLGRATGGRTPA